MMEDDFDFSGGANLPKQIADEVLAVLAMVRDDIEMRVHATEQFCVGAGD